MAKSSIIILTLLSINLSFAQKVGDTKTAIELLNRELPDTAIQVIKDIHEGQLLNFLNSSYEFRSLVDDQFFKSYKTSKLERRFKKSGLTESGLILEVILRAYKRSLLGQDQELEILKNKYAAIEDRWDKQTANVASTDTLRGVYVPIDLEDCWRYLDQEWSEETKKLALEKSEDDFSVGQHFGLGLWMRNSWGLWAGSRLARYFNENGIEHPDNMSSIIVRTYYQHLRGEEIDIEELFKNIIEDNN